MIQKRITSILMILIVMIIVVANSGCINSKVKTVKNESLINNSNGTQNGNVRQNNTTTYNVSDDSDGGFTYNVTNDSVIINYNKSEPNNLTINYSGTFEVYVNGKKVGVFNGTTQLSINGSSKIIIKVVTPGNSDNFEIRMHHKVHRIKITKIVQRLKNMTLVNKTIMMNVTVDAKTGKMHMIFYLDDDGEMKILKNISGMFMIPINNIFVGHGIKLKVVPKIVYDQNIGALIIKYPINKDIEEDDNIIVSRNALYILNTNGSIKLDPRIVINYKIINTEPPRPAIIIYEGNAFKVYPNGSIEPLSQTPSKYDLRIDKLNDDKLLFKLSNKGLIKFNGKIIIGTSIVSNEDVVIIEPPIYNKMIIFNKEIYHKILRMMHVNEDNATQTNVMTSGKYKIIKYHFANNSEYTYVEFIVHGDSDHKIYVVVTPDDMKITNEHNVIGFKDSNGNIYIDIPLNKLISGDYKVYADGELIATINVDADKIKMEAKTFESKYGITVNNHEIIATRLPKFVDYDVKCEGIEWPTLKQQIIEEIILSKLSDKNGMISENVWEKVRDILNKPITIKMNEFGLNGKCTLTITKVYPKGELGTGFGELITDNFFDPIHVIVNGKVHYKVPFGHNAVLQFVDGSSNDTAKLYAIIVLNYNMTDRPPTPSDIYVKYVLNNTTVNYIVNPYGGDQIPLIGNKEHEYNESILDDDISISFISQTDLLIIMDIFVTMFNVYFENDSQFLHQLFNSSYMLVTTNESIPINNTFEITKIEPTDYKVNFNLTKYTAKLIVISNNSEPLRIFGSPIDIIMLPRLNDVPIDSMMPTSDDTGDIANSYFVYIYNITDGEILHVPSDFDVSKMAISVVSKEYGDDPYVYIDPQLSAMIYFDMVN